VWSPGDVIVVEEVWRGRLWAVRPVIVVDDASERVVLWSPEGTRRTVPATPSTRPVPATRGERHAEMLARLDWDFAESVWDVSTL
jgi:hypothetical protein